MEAEKAEQEDLNWISAPRLLPPPTERTESRLGRMEEKRHRRKGDAETEDRGGGTQAAHKPPGKKKRWGNASRQPRTDDRISERRVWQSEDVCQEEQRHKDKTLRGEGKRKMVIKCRKEGAKKRG